MELVPEIYKELIQLKARQALCNNDGTIGLQWDQFKLSPPTIIEIKLRWKLKLDINNKP